MISSTKAILITLLVLFPSTLAKKHKLRKHKVRKHKLQKRSLTEYCEDGVINFYQYCGSLHHCSLVSSSGNKFALTESGSNIVKPGRYQVDCESTGAMCMLTFLANGKVFAYDGEDDETGLNCNKVEADTEWNTNGATVEITDSCEPTELKVSGITWECDNKPCSELKYSVIGSDSCVPPPPPPPTSNCQVDYACAKCGQILECYVNAAAESSEYMSTKKYIESSDFCDGFKTKCGGQQCAMKEGLKVYPAINIDRTCPVLGSFQCKAGAGKKNGAGLSNWATYQFDTCDDQPIQCSEKCDSGKACGCEFGSDTFCSGC